MPVARSAHLSLVDLGTSTSESQAFDAGGADTLLVAVNDQVNSAGNTIAVAFNGVALTKMAVRARSGSNREIMIWGLHNPASGSHNITITRTSGGAVVRVGAVGVTGTSTSTPLPVAPANDAGTAQVASGTSIGVSLSNGAGAYCYAITVTDSGGQSAGTGSTNLSNDDIIGEWEGNPTPATASLTMNVSCTSGSLAMCMVALEAAATATGGFFLAAMH